MEKTIHDNELGIITLRVSSRSRRYSIKVISGQVIASMPASGDESALLDFINAKREKIVEMLERNPPPSLLDCATELHTATFDLRIVTADRKNLHTQLKDGILTITCPHDTCFEDKRIQTLLNTILKNVFRHEAKRLLPGRLMSLAKQHGFTCNEVKINSSRSHWGSCTSRKTINLSLYLMKLPLPLIDYVLLHELCHTVEMNHSDRFWALMDRVTEGNAKALRRELKAYRVN